MYVSYLLEKEGSMYPGSVRCNSSSSSNNNNNNLPAQNFASTTPYADYMGYHPMQNIDHRGQPGAWGAHYGLQREDWNAYGPAPSNTVTATQMNGSSPGQVSYSSADYNSLNPAGSGALPSVNTINTEQISPHSQRHSSYEWMRKTVQSTSTGKTRTREKYRVVYTDHQRLELEKEFHYNRYITIRRKSELAANLRLSERQVEYERYECTLDQVTLFISPFTLRGSSRELSHYLPPVPGTESEPLCMQSTCSVLNYCMSPPLPKLLPTYQRTISTACSCLFNSSLICRSHWMKLFMAGM
uniref:Homeobox domain-containing protein n=1 Tax=Podarcis muralis TaxID=64176 RepID=A0A670K4R3_PODMU